MTRVVSLCFVGSLAALSGCNAGSNSSSSSAAAASGASSSATSGAESSSGAVTTAASGSSGAGPAGTSSATTSSSGATTTTSGTTSSSSGSPSSSSGSTGGGCSIVGYWKQSFTAGTFQGSFESGFFADGGGIWNADEPNGDNYGTGEYTFDGSTLTVTNLTVTEQQDPNFQPCIGVTGQYTVSFADACDQFTLALISDTCVVREADASQGGAAVRFDGGS